MLYENTGIAKAIAGNYLPPTLIELFGDLYEPQHNRFLVQETTIIDFKESIPLNFTDPYEIGIIRPAVALHNTYGGLIVFGVVDRTFTPAPVYDVFNIEAFNRCISDFTGRQIECSFRRYPTNETGAELGIQIVLVPPRTSLKPVRLQRPLGKYPARTLWVRDRHEVLEATSRHLPLLYSDRSGFLSKDNTNSSLIHRSLPPSPSTIEEFIGRFDLMDGLWDWLVCGSQPRLYLHGPGGSGKSTLAHEFAASLADAPLPVRIGSGSGHRLDFVIFLSAKETAFDPLRRDDSVYARRDFSNATEQFSQILYHSGLISEVDAGDASATKIEECLSELVENFTGLIVIDDIDALSRRGQDTGEEPLFIKAVQASGRVKILYTLRYAPPYAMNSAREVPSLEFGNEFHPFMEACCQQFEVPLPDAATTVKLFEESAGLPLLVETIVGLRRTSSSYADAFNGYRAREGDAARRYLYQREYDRLEVRSKSRQVLAALALINSPVEFTTIAHITSSSEAQVRDAITETKGIFLRTSETEGGDTLYDVTAPSLSFLQQVSRTLPYYPALERAVQHFKQDAIRTPAKDAALLFRFTKLAREAQFEPMIEEASGISSNDTIWGNPRFLGLLGQAYASKGGANAEDAREYFRRAFALHDRDIFMLRSWYKLEFLAPHTIVNAETLCRDILATVDLPPRYRSEFHSKLGQVLENQSRSHIYTNRERAIALMKESLLAYMEGAWISRSVNQLDRNLQREWLSQATGKLFAMLGNDPEPLFDLIEALAQSKHDVDGEAASVLLEPLRRLAPALSASHLGRVAGLVRRSLGRLSRAPKPLLSQPGFSYMLSTLQEILADLTAQHR